MTLERLVGVAAWPGALVVYGLLAWQRRAIARVAGDVPARRGIATIHSGRRSLPGYAG